LSNSNRNSKRESETTTGSPAPTWKETTNRGLNIETGKRICFTSDKNKKAGLAEKNLGKRHDYGRKLRLDIFTGHSNR
jgi:hypothetical protein